VAILVLGLGAVAATFRLALRSGAAAREEMAALNAGRIELEDLTSRPFDDPSLDGRSYAFTAAGYQGRYTVTVVNASIKDVKVTVNWYSMAGRASREVTLTTTMASTLH
jgi:hypothetical protein